MFFDRILGMFSSDIGIDLGTANTLVYVGTGHRPARASVVAIQAGTTNVLAVGEEANACWAARRATSWPSGP